MTIHIDLKNPTKMMYLVELLRSLDFVERVSVQEDVEKLITKPLSFFEKYNGSMPNLDVSAFENYLAETRQEWERPRS